MAATRVLLGCDDYCCAAPQSFLDMGVILSSKPHRCFSWEAGPRFSYHHRNHERAGGRLPPRASPFGRV